MPGVMVQTAVFGALLTGVGLSEDVKTGVVDRFRSLPIARSAVLFGRTAADMAINVLTLGVMLLVGFAVGFRPSEPVWDLGLAFVLVLAFSYVFSWISAFIGLTMREPETAQSASLLLVFPLAFASSAFVPANSMPGVVQTFAEVNPMTLMVDAARALTLGQGEALDPTPGRSPGWWGCSPCSSPGRAGVPPGLTLAFGRGADEPAPLHLRLPVAPARRVGPCPTSQRIRRIELTHLDL
jgi:ABC transporter DrrB family efflux protein